MTTLAAPSFEQSALLLAWVAIVLLAFAMSGLLRQVHALTQAMQRGRTLAGGPTTGMTAPKIGDADGARRSVLLFVDHGCSSCDEAIATLARERQANSHDDAYVVLYRNAPNGGPPPPDVTVVPHAARLFDDLNVVVTPTLVVLDERRQVIASAPVGSRDALNEFMTFVRQREASR
jgi:hypothetical protein